MKNTVIKTLALSAVITAALSFAACSSNEAEGEGSSEGTNPEPIGTVEPSESLPNPVTLPEIRTDLELSNPRETTATTKLETELSPIETPSAELTPVIPPTEKASAAAETAKAQVGKLFKFGGASPEEGFDNSGLVYYALTQNGIKCPRTVKEMSVMGEKKTMDQLTTGDILFFNMDNEEKSLFVALYIGEGKAVISTDEGKPVKIADINSPWYKSVFAYGITPEG